MTRPTFSLYITTYGETSHAGNWVVETEADLAEMKAEAMVTIGQAIDQSLGGGGFEIRLDKIEVENDDVAGRDLP